MTTGIGIGFLLFAETRLTGALAAPDVALLAAARLAVGFVAMLVSGCATESFGWVVDMLMFLDSNNQ
ncbi:hypothetical protein [Rhodoferax sp.]|uniref:hypothetical protein n=1 Tax=Rhodoferax sp. TaxID=50421 RepID=UPI00262DEE68|nr:hypothetical protein [Rhodoferax sp.]MDD2919554.1 hypothetical protein [Rhodoferax sp.]